MKKCFLLLYTLAVLSVVIARGEGHNNYHWDLDFAFGSAYNINTNQVFSTNNVQLCSVVSTTHGYKLRNWFVGGGVGYYHSYRDEENMLPIFTVGRYSAGNDGNKPFFEVRAGIIYDRLWIEKVQKYGAFTVGIKVNKGLQMGFRLSAFSRPSRFFTANAAIVLSYGFGQ